MDTSILIVTGDAGESYECLYARHRRLEAGLTPVIAAPSRRRLHLVMHDFEEGWDTYVERPGLRRGGGRGPGRGARRGREVERRACDPPYDRRSHLPAPR